jgi:hypothetical protein
MRTVALYQGGITKGIFCGLFALLPKDASALPHTAHRRTRGGTYLIYGSEAIDRVLTWEGMPALRLRIAKRARSITHGASFSRLTAPRGMTEQAGLERYLHMRAQSTAQYRITP